MTDFGRGLYEVLITKELERRLKQLEARLVADSVGLRSAEAADRIALHLGRVVQKAIDALPEKEQTSRGIAMARQLIQSLDQILPEFELAGELPLDPGQVLSAILQRDPRGEPTPIAGPLTPLLDTTLLTNAPGEPRVGQEIVTEIDSSDRIDVVMAFIRRSGINPTWRSQNQESRAKAPRRKGRKEEWRLHAETTPETPWRGRDA